MELDVLFSKEKEIKVSGVTIKIRSIELQDISKLTNLMSGKIIKGLDQTGMMLEILKDQELIVALFQATTDLKKEVILKLNMSAASEILSEVILENVSFFTTAVLPKLKKMTEGLQVGS